MNDRNSLFRSSRSKLEFSARLPAQAGGRQRKQAGPVPLFLEREYPITWSYVNLRLASRQTWIFPPRWGMRCLNYLGERWVKSDLFLVSRTVRGRTSRRGFGYLSLGLLQNT